MTHLMDTYPPQPVTFVRGAGTELWDDKGRRYLDFLSGLAVTSLGHSHPAVADAVDAQARTLLHVSNLFGTEPGLEVAATLDRLLGGGGKVFFCNSGAEANECGIKLARKWGGRGKHVVVSAYGSFHGRTLATLHATGQPQKHEPFQPLPEGFRHVAWDDLDALASALDPSTAAVLLEPVQGEGGVNPATPEYFQGVRRLCDERGALLIVDEVQTGLGRTGRWFGFQHLGVAPDVVTMAKALGNGVPIGACWARDDVARAFEPGDHATTFGGQPLATAAARAVLGEMERIDVPTLAAKAGARLTDALAAMAGITAVRGLGLLLAAQLADGLDAKQVTADALAAGLVVNAVTPTALRFAPPLTVSDAEIDEAVAILDSVLSSSRHFLDVDDLTPDELTDVLDRAEVTDPPRVLDGKGVALLFEKPSLRTRHSSEMAVVQLGGHPLTFRGDEVGPRSREPLADIARVLSGYHAAFGARVFDHAALEELASSSSIPIVNLLSDRAHPCQALADLLTVRQSLGALKGRTLAWVGDFNNVARSLSVGAAMTGMQVRLACPPGYGPADADLDRLAGLGATDVFVTTRPAEAAKGADIVSTDVWASMGQEAEAEAPPARLRGLQRRRRDDDRRRPVGHLPALPARAPGRRVRCFGDRRPASPRVATGPQPHARVPGPPVVAGGVLNKPQRQHRIAQLLEHHSVTSQAQLVELLGADSVVATQATVSRDLEDLGAIKVRGPGGESVYAIPALPKEQRAPEDHLRRVLGDWVVEVAHSGNLVVVRTPPGSAHVVGSAIDRSDLPDVLGTVAGDDTLLVIAVETVGGAKVASRLSDLAGL